MLVASALPSLSQFGRGRLSLFAISFYALSLLFGPCGLLEFTLAGPLQIHRFRSIDRSLHPAELMPWIIFHFGGFLCVRDAECRGNKITDLSFQCTCKLFCTCIHCVMRYKIALHGMADCLPKDFWQEGHLDYLGVFGLYTGWPEKTAKSLHVNWRLRNECRNSKLMTCHSSVPGGASDWSCRKINLRQPIKSTTQILV